MDMKEIANRIRTAPVRRWRVSAPLYAGAERVTLCWRRCDVIHAVREMMRSGMTDIRITTTEVRP